MSGEHLTERIEMLHMEQEVAFAEGDQQTLQIVGEQLDELVTDDVAKGVQEVQQVAGDPLMELAVQYALTYSDTYGDITTGIMQARQRFGVSGPELSDRLNTIIGKHKANPSLFED